jgi:hypothetical protein
MSLIVPFDLEIQHLKMFDNAKQLDILHREVAYIIRNGINPVDEWYDDRFEYIIKYSQLNWNELAERFNDRDKYIYDTSIEIIKLINRLVEERATKRYFYIPTYHTMIYHIKNCWDYYNNTYICGETDIDVVDLVEGMTFL